MKLDNFKELLLKKSEDNDSLQLLIKYMRDDYLIDHVVESLEKMASSYSKKNPNASVKHFASNMNNFKSGMIHDALSHHASHYKAAVDAGDTNVADNHMRQIFKTMHMADKFTKDGLTDHSSGRLNISAIDPKPWERSGYTNTKRRDGGEAGKFTTDTQGWKRHSGNMKYDWLRKEPHPSYGDEISRHGHNNAYPLEEIKVNNKFIDVDNKVEHDGRFTPHPFDAHPIYKHYNESPSVHGADKKAQYLESRDAFHEDENGGKSQYKAKLANMSKEDYANRGLDKSDPVHKRVERVDPQPTEQTNKPVEAKPVEAKKVITRKKSEPRKIENFSNILKQAQARGNKDDK